MVVPQYPWVYHIHITILSEQNTSSGILIEGKAITRLLRAVPVLAIDFVRRLSLRNVSTATARGLRHSTASM